MLIGEVFQVDIAVVIDFLDLVHLQQSVQREDIRLTSLCVVNLLEYVYEHGDTKKDTRYHDAKEYLLVVVRLTEGRFVLLKCALGGHFPQTSKAVQQKESEALLGTGEGGQVGHRLQVHNGGASDELRL